MPIKPDNKKRYPKNWATISRRIRFDRANSRCECTGLCEHDHDEGRCGAVHGHPHPVTGSKVILTTAHLDHTPENCDDDNLLAMCQRCHNAYDREHRNQTRRQTHRENLACGDLFDGLALQIVTRVKQSALAKALDISASELSRKLHGENGWSIKQFLKALDFAGLQLVLPTQVTIKPQEYEALQTFARKWLNRGKAE